MWTLVALFCNIVEPEKGKCVPAVPPAIFQTYEACRTFGIDETEKINLEKVSYDFQCVKWNNEV